MLEWRSKTLDACLMGHIPLIATSIIRPSQLFGLDEAAALFRPHTELSLGSLQTGEQRSASNGALLAVRGRVFGRVWQPEYGCLNRVPEAMR